MVQKCVFDGGLALDSVSEDRHEAVVAQIAPIRDAVRDDGDAAVIRYTAQFDRVDEDGFSLRVSQAEFDAAFGLVSSEFLNAIHDAKARIAQFHENQQPIEWEESVDDGYAYGMQYRPIDTVGLYVPGGRALYPSSVLMNAIPAKLAGVKTTVMVTPPRADGTVAPEVLVAAQECGVDVVIKSGGAQAVFALAYGTASVPKVDKIVGPGNVYVDTAKRMVYGLVDIDKPAGPSEVLVYIEDGIYAAFAASEVLAQCEHDPDARAVVVSPSDAVLDVVLEQIETQKQRLDRVEIIDQALENACLYQVSDRQQGVQVMDKIASEHVVLMVDDAESLKKEVTHAGAIFCGPYTPVALGDYVAGPNHVLPTAGAARFSSPLSVMDFVKFSTHLTVTKEGLAALAPSVKALTDVEQLGAHYQSVVQRLNLDVSSDG